MGNFQLSKRMGCGYVIPFYFDRRVTFLWGASFWAYHLYYEKLLPSFTFFLSGRYFLPSSFSSIIWRGRPMATKNNQSRVWFLLLDIYLLPIIFLTTQISLPLIISRLFIAWPFTSVSETSRLTTFILSFRMLPLCIQFCTLANRGWVPSPFILFEIWIIGWLQAPSHCYKPSWIRWKIRKVSRGRLWGALRWKPGLGSGNFIWGPALRLPR